MGQIFLTLSRSLYTNLLKRVPPAYVHLRLLLKEPQVALDLLEDLRGTLCGVEDADCVGWFLDKTQLDEMWTNVITVQGAPVYGASVA